MCSQIAVTDRYESRPISFESQKRESSFFSSQKKQTEEEEATDEDFFLSLDETKISSGEK